MAREQLCGRGRTVRRPPSRRDTATAAAARRLERNGKSLELAQIQRTAQDRGPPPDCQRPGARPRRARCRGWRAREGRARRALRPSRSPMRRGLAPARRRTRRGRRKRSRCRWTGRRRGAQGRAKRVGVAEEEGKGEGEAEAAKATATARDWCSASLLPARRVSSRRPSGLERTSVSQSASSCRACSRLASAQCRRRASAFSRP